MSNHVRLFMRCQVLIVLLLLFFGSQSVVYALEGELSLAEKNYQQLRAALPIYQNAAEHPWPIVPDNKKLKLGAKNSAVPLLRERLEATGDLPPSDIDSLTHFDSTLEEAVIGFQNRHGLKADGIVGPNTLAELNVPAYMRIRQIEVNMERWANLAHQFTNRFILVNIPDFHLYVFENNKKILTLKTIVGKTDWSTPELSSRITRLVFNPYWNVPNKIAEDDIVPKMINDPSYLDSVHIRVFRNQEDNAREINPYDINWANLEDRTFPYFLRQEPGEDNALGQVKFEFQNSNDVYLHDTPTKTLFDQDHRTLSHGCIRLEDPFTLVSYLMQSDPKWSEERLNTILDLGKTTYVKAPDPIPIFVTYLTAWADDDGLINFRDDVYDKDQ